MSDDGMLYDSTGALVYTALPTIRPGKMVCLIDAEFNQVTPWVPVSDQWTASWTSVEADVTVTRHLLRDVETTMLSYGKLDSEIRIRPGTTIQLDLRPAVGGRP